MNHDTREGLLDAADALAFAADRLAGLAEEHDQEVPAEPQDSTRWMRGARRELAELIREIEGPNPPQAPRRNA
jgi:hypothetical protein